MKKLKALRKQRGLSQTDLAGQCNLDQSYISRIENGQSNPTIDVLQTLAKSLNVTAASLLENEPEDQAA